MSRIVDIRPYGAIISAFAVALALFLTLGAGSALAAKPEIYTGLLSNVAIGGYDAVAYFREGKPVKGSRDFTHDWKGAEWRFASAANRDAFAAAPEAFAPQYGGYCAWAVSQGYTAKGDPAYWRIVDGKLYLNYDAKTQKSWEEDIPGNIKTADGNWPGVLEQ